MSMLYWSNEKTFQFITQCKGGKSSSYCSRGWIRPLVAFGLINSAPLNRITSRPWHNQKTEYCKPVTRSVLPSKLFNVGDSTTSSGRPFHMLTVRKPKKFAISFVLQYLFWIFKQCPLVSCLLAYKTQRNHLRGQHNALDDPMIMRFLADRTNGSAYATVLRLSVCRLWRYVLWLNGAS